MVPPNALCASATVLDLGAGVVADVRGTTANAGDESSSIFGGGGGNDVYYQFTLTATELVYVDTFGSATDTAAYLIQGSCNGALVNGAGSDDTPACATADRKASRFVASLPAGTYFLVVDTARGAAGAFTLRVSRSGTGCAQATPLVSGTVSNPESNCSGSGMSLLNPNPTSCVFQSAATATERTFYLLSCPQSGGRTLTASTCQPATAATTDTVLYVRNFTCQSADIAGGCNDDVASGACASAPYASTVSNVALGASGGIHYVVVDSYLDTMRCGTFQVLASVTP